MRFNSYLIQELLQRFKTAAFKKGLRNEEQKMKAINHTLRFGTSTMLAVVLGSYLYSSSAHGAEVQNISKIMGGVRIEAQDQVGDISSINGGIDLKRGAHARDIDTVNGGIELADEVVVDDAETVNGGIDLGNNVTVNGSLETVNGGIEIRSGSTIENSVETVNGRIRLTNTRVGDNVATVNGDLILRDETVIEGDLRVGGRRSFFSRMFNWNNSKSDVVIDGSSSVRGDIHLYEEVNLRIEDGADVGDIIEHY